MSVAADWWRRQQLRRLGSRLAKAKSLAAAERAARDITVFIAEPEATTVSMVAAPPAPPAVPLVDAKRAAELAEQARFIAARGATACPPAFVAPSEHRQRKLGEVSLPELMRGGDPKRPGSWKLRRVSE